LSKHTEILTDSIGYLTGRAHRGIREAMSVALNNAGLDISPAQLPAIGCLILRDGAPVNQCKMSEHMNIDRHRVSRIVKDLEGKGWINSIANPHNKRENLIELSQRGVKLLPIIRNCAKEIAKRAFNGCTAEERSITLDTLKKINNNLNNDE
jgi:DNA-binding MarR family transcriptional regulator